MREYQVRFCTSCESFNKVKVLLLELSVPTFRLFMVSGSVLELTLSSAAIKSGLPTIVDLLQHP